MSISEERLADFGRRIESEWRSNIAPFWLTHGPDETNGGLRGWIANDLRVDELAEKGLILNARVLWTFSCAHRLFPETAYRKVAEIVYSYLTRHFVDRDLGGVFWTVDNQGRPSDTRKKVYGQAFAIYGLTEFFLATGEQAALDLAFGIFELLETRCRDKEYDGYFETFERDWSLASEQRLSAVDQDEKKSMNTHLHVLEAYTVLYRAAGGARVRERLRALFNLFLSRIIDQGASSLRMFFDETWGSRSDHDSFGHDIEASWLLCEAAEALCEPEILEKARAVALNLAQSVYEKARDSDGGLFYEGRACCIIDDDKHWWVQAEGVVGFLNAYQLSGDDRYLSAAVGAWEFIERHIVDRENGEWFWKVSRAGKASPEMPKVSQWKGPYHNGRMCFEVIRRLAEIKEST
jgi:mannobiose 2-epimerase